MTNLIIHNEQYNIETAWKKIEKLIINFNKELQSDQLREKVLSLVPIFHGLRNLGKSLIPHEKASAARDRILYYFQKYPKTIIHGDELLVISGIQEYARRLRELRVQFGWAIVSGITIIEMYKDDESFNEFKNMRPDEYILLNAKQDREAALRWNLANSIRKQPISVHEKILKFFRANVGKRITNEEIRYVAGNRSEWARRVRELRTEFGWPISTKSTGRPELEIGTYILESTRQSPEHDRHIPDEIRRQVLRRQGYKCKKCSWAQKEWNPSDPRHLELHHIKHHAVGGENSQENLMTICNICHDKIHKRHK
jgi:hypothetical protein